MAAAELLVSGAIDEVIEDIELDASLAVLSVDELPPEHADNPSAATAATPAKTIRRWLVRMGVKDMSLNFLVGGSADAIPFSPTSVDSVRPAIRIGCVKNSTHPDPVGSLVTGPDRGTMDP
jgi:1-deoxy-D-xylulose-5-phosphate reductoisomerase